MSLNRSILATALTGASGAGGTLIYHHAIPWTWREVLVKEGCYFLNSENEYKAVWSEHKTTLIEKIQELNSKKQTFNKESIQKWCESQLKGNYSKDPSSSTNINSLCTHRGITTVKAKLILSGYDGFIDDEEQSEREELYKIAFAIQRYYDKFIEWVKKFHKDKTVNNEDLKEDANLSTGWLALSSACHIELNKPNKDVTDINHYTYLFWWCKKFPYTKIEELVKAKDPTWEYAETWDGKADKWKYNEKILERYGQGKDEHDKAKSINDSSVGGWCAGFKDAKLSVNDSYRHGYLILRYVCRKDPPKKPKSQKSPQGAQAPTKQE